MNKIWTQVEALEVVSCIWGLSGWPKISFRFFCIILWKNAKELFDQLDTCRGKVTEDEKFNDAIGVNNYYIFLDFCE